MTTNHPAHGPVSLDRLHHIREHLQHDTQYSNGGNRAYILADVLKVIDGAIAREQVRSEHAAWSLATFGDVGPVGPLKHLSKEALEAAAEPGDLSEWADMQFLLWDAQRRAGISDEQITQAMVEKLAVNKQREWPEPKDGEPRLHIKEYDNSFVAPEGTACKYCGGTGYFRWKKSANTFPCPCMGCDLPVSFYDGIWHMVSKLKQRRIRRLKADVAWWKSEAEYGKARVFEQANEIAELRSMVIRVPMPVMVPVEILHQLNGKGSKEYPLCRNCNDGTRHGCSSCAYRMK